MSDVEAELEVEKTVETAVETAVPKAGWTLKLLILTSLAAMATVAIKSGGLTAEVAVEETVELATWDDPIGKL